MLHQVKKFKMPHWPIPRGSRDIKYGLERITKLLNKLGNPHLKLPPVIHVSGTNGKGSTLAYLEAILKDAGYRVHKYTSPHLIDFNERIVLNGEQITDAMLYELGEKCRYICEEDDIPITFFEGTTAMAFLAFSEVPADILLLETGMGGRLDATNVIENPVATIITNISFDHMEYLGNTIAEIAKEKAGIIKKGGFSVIGWQVSEAMDVLLQKTSKLEIETYACGQNWKFSTNYDETFNVEINDVKIHLSKPSLHGLHQYVNASAAAVTAIRLMIDDRFEKLHQRNIINGLQNTFWPARLQKIDSGVLSKLIPSNMEIWLDGAHNESGAQMLIASMKKMKPTAILYMIHGRTRHRDMKSFLQHFVNHIEFVNCVEIMNEPDSEDPHAIDKCCKELGVNSSVSLSVKDAVSEIIEMHEKKYGNKLASIIICGSLYLAGDILAANMEL